jgi:hypothetical protein
MMVHEGLLHRVQLFAISQSLDGPNLFAVRLYGKHQARAHRFAVDNDRAGAANAMFATDVRARLPTILADRVRQRTPRLDADRMVAAVNCKRNCGLFLHAAFSLARKAARMRCGVAGISSISTPNGESASLIALITAAGAPMQPPSPKPLAMVMEFGLGVSM